MEVKPEPRRSFSLRLRRPSSSKSLNQLGNESFSRAEEEMHNVVTKSSMREPRMSFTRGLLRASSSKPAQSSLETSSDGPETENREPKPEPRRSFSLRLRRSSSSASMQKKAEETASDNKKESKKKTKKGKKSFPRIGGLVRRLSARKKSKSIVMEQAPATSTTSGVNASFETQDTSDPSEKSVHQVDLNFLGYEDFDIESEEAEELDASFLVLAPEEKALDVIVLVIDPKTRHFEIVLLEFFLNDFHVSDLLARVPASVVQEELRKLKFEGVCDLKKRVFSDDTLMTDVCPNGRDILVAIPKGVAAEVCSKQARIILNDKEVLQLLKSTGIDSSVWVTEVTIEDTKVEQTTSATKTATSKAAGELTILSVQVKETPAKDDVSTVMKKEPVAAPADEETPKIEEPAAITAIGDIETSEELATIALIDDLETSEGPAAIVAFDDIETPTSSKEFMVVTDIQVAVKDTQRTVVFYLLLAMPLLVLMLTLSLFPEHLRAALESGHVKPLLEHVKPHLESFRELTLSSTEHVKPLLESIREWTLSSTASFF